MQSVFQVNVGIAGGLPHPLFFNGYSRVQALDREFSWQVLYPRSHQTEPFLSPSVKNEVILRGRATEFRTYNQAGRERMLGIGSKLQ